MLPVRFTGFDGETVRWEYQDEYTVRVGSFVLHRNGQYVSREKKIVGVLYVRQRKDADWLCYYCSHCQTLLRAYELKPGSRFD